MPEPSLKIDKLHAARRQLQTSIQLWFGDGDPISAHALAFAAYEVLHAVSKKRNPNRQKLLFDAGFIRDEYRSEYNIALKKHAYFFKHADRNPDAVIDFYPVLTTLFVLGSIMPIQSCGETPNEYELAFVSWQQFHRPNWFVPDESGKTFLDLFPIQYVAKVRNIPKSDFLEAYIAARKQLGLG
jgi:hypothetical protein